MVKSHHKDARSFAKTNALTTEPSLQLLGIILYILLNFYELFYPDS